LSSRSQTVFKRFMVINIKRSKRVAKADNPLNQDVDGRSHRK
jgi:hypothetical protein